MLKTEGFKSYDECTFRIIEFLNVLESKIPDSGGMDTTSKEGLSYSIQDIRSIVCLAISGVRNLDGEWEREVRELSESINV